MLIAHLDFKGVLPRVEHLPRLLHDISDLGYDAVLVEYEDIFPFQSLDLAIDENEKWSRQTLQDFLNEAARLNLQVVPLQQTLGHLEYVLRWNQYRDFSFPNFYPSTIDISREEPRELALTLLREVLEAHPDSRYIHLGMDEAQALIGYAKRSERDVVVVFLDYLETLCDECEKFGVKPVIWSDMLEDHFSPAALDRFKQFSQRVVLCSWDYEADGKRTSWARLNGIRAAKVWRENPLLAKLPNSAPPLSATQLFVEDLDAAAKTFIERHFDGETFASLFWCDAWRGLGFEVWGASSSRTSGDGAILPFFHQRVANVQTWNQAIERTGASGHVVTSWARGTTFCPPIFPFDATWFVLQEAARAAKGSTPSAFFDGIAEADVTRIFQSLGKCREDWRIETQLAEEMRALAPQLKTHQWEWEATALLAEVLAWSRQANFAHEEITYFECNDLLPDGEWERRLNDHAEIRAKGLALRAQVETHFAQLYHGRAFQEWMRDLFDVPLARMENDSLHCRAKLENSHSRYAR